MKVPHLNEFLRRAIREGLLGRILMDFSATASHFCDRRVVYAAEPPSYGRLTLFRADGAAGKYYWDLGNSSVEILRIGLTSGINNKKIILHLGRACSSTGTQDNE